MTDQPKNRFRSKLQGRFDAPADESPRPLDALIAAPPAELVQRAEAPGYQLVHLPIDQVAPDPEQLRRLAHPQRLREQAAQGDRTAAADYQSLQQLGASVREHGQLQPIVVYRFVHPHEPRQTYRIFMGQRRWSAAVIEGLPTVWAIIADPPSPVVRILRQYAENEQREELSDIERVWAMQRLKAALEDERGQAVPWRVVEEYVTISETRRQDLMRLLRFAAAAQLQVARLRRKVTEWSLRPLTMGLQSGVVTHDQALQVLQALTDLDGVNQTTVANLLAAQGRQDAAGEAVQHGDQGQASSGQATSSGLDATAAALAALPAKLHKQRQAVEKITQQVSPEMSADVRERLLKEAQALAERIGTLILQLEQE